MIGKSVCVCDNIFTYPSSKSVLQVTSLELTSLGCPPFAKVLQPRPQALAPVPTSSTHRRQLSLLPTQLISGLLRPRCFDKPRPPQNRLQLICPPRSQQSRSALKRSPRRLLGQARRVCTSRPRLPHSKAPNLLMERAPRRRSVEGHPAQRTRRKRKFSVY